MMEYPFAQQPMHIAAVQDTPEALLLLMPSFVPCAHVYILPNVPCHGKRGRGVRGALLPPVSLQFTRVMVSSRQAVGKLLHKLLDVVADAAIVYQCFFLAFGVHCQGGGIIKSLVDLLRRAGKHRAVLIRVATHSHHIVERDILEFIHML